MISIYLSNESIQILTGDAKFGILNINEYYLEGIPERSIINGVITDPEAIKNSLGFVWEKYKLPSSNIHLVIDIPSAMGKVMTVPDIAEKKILKLVEREFSGSYTENTLYDYANILGNIKSLSREEKAKQKKKPGIDIYASAVNRELIGKYIKLFESQGIKLQSINLGMNSVIKLGHFLRSLRGRTYIIMALDGNSMASFLFINGRYNISNKYRLTYERGSVELASEIARQTSSLIQFNSSQKSGFQIEQVYLCGLHSDEQGYGEYIKGALGIPASKLPLLDTEVLISHNKASKFDLADNIYVAGNLI